MTRDNAKSVELVRELTPDELDAVSGGGVENPQKPDGSKGALSGLFDAGGKGLADVGGKGLVATACCDGKH